METMGYAETNIWKLHRIYFAGDNEKSVYQLDVPQQYRDTVFKHYHDIPSGGQLKADNVLERIQRTFLLASRVIVNEFISQFRTPLQLQSDGYLNRSCFMISVTSYT